MNMNTPSSNNSLTDVTTALKKFIATEHLDSGYKCESCGKVGKATKQSKLKAIPPILTLHLKRFRYGNEKMALTGSAPSRRRNATTANAAAPESAGMGYGYGSGSGDMNMGGMAMGSSGSAKIEGHVKFPLVFDIRPYLTEEMQGTVKSMLCRLFAVIVHSGKNSHSGHYVSYVRNVAKNEWWKMDDAKVMLVPKEEVFAAEAYMLFYRVVDHPVSVELKNKEEEIFKREAEAVEKAKAALASDDTGNSSARVNVSGSANHDSVAAASSQATATSATATTSSTSMLTTSPSSTSNANVTANENANVTNANITNGKKRKRDTPEFKSGEEWARKMTNKPKSMLHFIRAAQDYLCERIEFKPEYMAMMKEEVESGNKVQNGPSFGISLQEDVANFDTLDGFRHALWTMFKTILPMEQLELEELFKPKEKKVNGNGNGNGGSNGNGNGNGGSRIGSDNAASGNNNANASKSESLVIPVVEHNDHLI